jgi:hypothetical protein
VCRAYFVAARTGLIERAKRGGLLQQANRTLRCCGGRFQEEIRRCKGSVCSYHGPKRLPLTQQLVMQVAGTVPELVQRRAGQAGN